MTMLFSKPVLETPTIKVDSKTTPTPVTPEEVREILELKRSGFNSKEIAEDMNLTRGQVSAVFAHDTMGTYN